MDLHQCSAADKEHERDHYGGAANSYAKKKKKQFGVPQKIVTTGEVQKCHDFVACLVS